MLSLQTIDIRGSAAGPHLLITGGVHGDEFEPMVALRRIGRTINPDSLRGRLTLIPVVNEPAFARGQRTAEDERDLARACPGRADGTTTERIADALSQKIQQADYYIDLHTGGTRIGVLPLVGYMLHPDNQLLDQQRRIAKAFNLPVVWGTDYRLEGRSLSVARDANVPAIYAEYQGSANCSSEGVEAYVTGCLNVLGCLQMIDRQPPPSAIQHVVEDHRPNSGHLQICNPSPMTGFFESSVKLGDSVREGDPLGTISDPLGNDLRTIRCCQNGIVLMLHTFCAVSEGTSLATILEF